MKSIKLLFFPSCISYTTHAQKNIVLDKVSVYLETYAYSSIIKMKDALEKNYDKNSSSQYDINYLTVLANIDTISINHSVVKRRNRNNFTSLRIFQNTF